MVNTAIFSAADLTDVGGVLRSEMLNKTSKIALWAANFRTVGDIAKMSSPPVVSMLDTNSSSINGLANAAGLPNQGKYTNMDVSGFNTSAVITGNSNNNALQGLGPANTDGSFPEATLWRARFTTIMPQFEVCFSERTGCRINAIIDGEFVGLYDGTVPPGLQSGQTRYMKFDFGNDQLSYGMASANISSGGTGYVRGEILTAQGGTFTRPAKVVVRAVSGSVVTAFTLLDPGDYSVLPSFPIGLTGGSGTGASLATGFTFPRHTTLKPRNVELLIEGAWLYGIHYVSPPSGEAAVTPYKRNPLCPSVYWLGDSQDAATYGVYAGGEVGYLACRRLGLADNIIIDARGGTGFNQPNGTAPAFEHSNRIAAAIAANPDILVFPYSQNVGSNTQATSQAAAISFIQQLMTALPKTLFVMIGPAYGYQSWHLAAMQATYTAAQAIDPTRIRMIDTITGGWAAGGSAGYLTTDNVHWGVWANLNWRSKLLANELSSAIIDMATIY